MDSHQLRWFCTLYHEVDLLSTYLLQQALGGGWATHSQNICRIGLSSQVGKKIQECFKPAGSASHLKSPVSSRSNKFPPAYLICPPGAPGTLSHVYTHQKPWKVWRLPSFWGAPQVDRNSGNNVVPVIVHLIDSSTVDTPLKTNMSPENQCLEHVFPIEIASF